MSNKKKSKKNDPIITARLTEQLENENEPAVEEIRQPEPSAPDVQPASENAGQTAESNETLEFIQTLESMDSELSRGYEEVAGTEEDVETEAEEETETVVRTAARPNRFYLVFAVFIIIMSIIGIFSTVNFIVGQIEDIADQTALKKEIALFIYPIVAVDPPEFSSADKIPPSVVIESAVWKIILTGDISNYEKLYSAYMYVPAVDVEFAARTMFGSEAVISHQTVGNVGSAFTYESEKNSYLVPISPRFTSYTPSVTSIENVGELYTVTVEYMPPSALAVEGVNLQNASAKSMEYTLSKTRNSMTIHSIRNIYSSGDVHAY